MRRSRAALAVGLFVVLAAFAYGVESTASTTVAGETVDCGPAISATWLVAGTYDFELATTAADRRAADACGPAVQRARAGVLSTMAAGALLALLGWTALLGAADRTKLRTTTSLSAGPPRERRFVLSDAPVVRPPRAGRRPYAAAVHVYIRPTQSFLSCHVCRGLMFAHREIKMTTTGMTFMDLDWLN